MTGSSPPPVVFLMGPTAAGKTDLAVALVERLPLEIVSVDSAMVYRGMDIGTGKPDPDTLARAPHRLIDIREPKDTYSAAQFRADALAAIDEILAAGRVPLLVGGTGLYFRALERGLSRLPGANAGVRATLQAEAAAAGWPALHARLATVDPDAARRIHPNDPQRIQRALEVYELTGRAMSALIAESGKHAPGFSVHGIRLEPDDRDWLHRRIARRFHEMLARGLVEEVADLRSSGRLAATMPAMRAVGYRQVWAYLDGDGDLPALAKRGIAATRQLARRQLTWLRAESRTPRFACDGGKLPDAVAAHLRGRIGALAGSDGDASTDAKSARAGSRIRLKSP